MNLGNFGRILIKKSTGDDKDHTSLLTFCYVVPSVSTITFKSSFSIFYLFCSSLDTAMTFKVSKIF